MCHPKLYEALSEKDMVPIQKQGRNRTIFKDNQKIIQVIDLNDF